MGYFKSIDKWYANIGKFHNGQEGGEARYLKDLAGDKCKLQMLTNVTD
jgi:hypothetical protein